MKKISAFVAGSAIALTAATAFAGGPVVIEEEDDPIVVAPVGSGLSAGVVAAGLAVLAIAAIASSDSSNDHNN